MGIPCSGTTHLVNLIARDQRRRALPFWEGRNRFLPITQVQMPAGIDPRFRRCAAEHEFVSQRSPHLPAMHDRFPDAIEEEVQLLDLGLGYTLEWHARVPGRRD